MTLFINYNGKLYRSGEKVLTAANRGYRYGDGFFETMKMIDGKICLEELHFERFDKAINLLEIKTPGSFNTDQFKKEILELSEKNGCKGRCRVRLSVSRGDGGVFDSNNFQYMVECWPLKREAGQLNGKGLVTDVFPDARKSMDKYSNLKSANYLPYVMAAIFTKEKNLDEAFVLNSAERICDATIANVFWIKDSIISTPPLTEGPVAGVMRRYILGCRQQIGDLGFELVENVLTEENLLNADEVFLTNAISNIRWVGQFREKKYGHTATHKIYDMVIKQLNS